MRRRHNDVRTTSKQRRFCDVDNSSSERRRNNVDYTTSIIRREGDVETTSIFSRSTSRLHFELTLSEVITRTDDLQLADKVNIYNNKLDNQCTERNWGFITHKSITKTHLNSYGLHLNQRGTTALARNIKQFLKNQSLN